MGPKAGGKRSVSNVTLEPLRSGLYLSCPETKALRIESSGTDETNEGGSWFCPCKFCSDRPGFSKKTSSLRTPLIASKY